MPEAFYRTGQVAKALGTSSHHIRRLCETNQIQAEVTEGQQWKIPLAELQRLQKTGVPPIPERLEPHNGRGLPVTTSPTPGLIGVPSDDVVAAHEAADIAVQQVQIRKSKIEGLKLHKEATELGDFFRARRLEREQAAAAEQEAELERAEAQGRAECARQEAARAAERRRDWINRWLTFAMDAPRSRYEWWEARGHVEAAIHDEVLPVLEKISSDQPDQIVKPLVLGAVERVIARWKRGKEIQQILTSAGVDWLPYGARGTRSELTTWQVRSMEAAAAAMRGLRVDASTEELRTVAREAAQKITAEFEHGQSCEKLIRELSVEVRGAGAEELEAAQKEVRKTLGALPLTSSQRDREDARDTTIRPLREQIAARQEQARQKRQDEQNRSLMEYRAGWRLGRHVDDYLLQLARIGEIEFNGPADFVSTSERLKAIVHPLLLKQLLAQPGMTDEEVKRQIEALVDEHLDEVLTAPTR